MRAIGGRPTTWSKSNGTMIVDAPFHSLSEEDQNRLLSALAHQIRPMLGEIGEVLVKADNSGNKPGFIGLLFGHGADKAIVFAEYVDETTRKKWRAEQPIGGKHVFDTSKLYIAEIIKAGTKDIGGGLGASDGLSAIDLSDDDTRVVAIFKGCYGEDAEKPDFKIKLLGKRLSKPKDDVTLSMIYFAVKDGDEFKPNEELIEQLAKLIEQLVRNALGLAAISNQELRGVASYLTELLPQSFNDYVRPQVLAAIYAYVREVVPVDTSGKTAHKPSIEPTDAPCAEKLKCIHTASSIRVTRAVGGSLKGASVYALTITTGLAHEGGSTSYSAIAKFSTLAEARDEADGLRRMQRYYSSIGKMLPAPLQVFLIVGADGKYSFEVEGKSGQWTEVPCISVTPDLEGVVLSEKITDYWPSPTRRVERFSGYLNQAKSFVDKIQQQPLELANLTSADSSNVTNHTEEPKQQLLDFFTKMSDREKERYTQLASGLAFPEHECLALKGVSDGECKLVNPAAWIRKMLSPSTTVEWVSHSARSKRSVLTHGDFHTGNLFFSSVGDHLTVLDYDRVGPGTPEEDLARLEASFVTFVFGLPDFCCGGRWNEYALPSLALLSGCHPFPVQLLEQNAFARDLLESLHIIRPAKPCPFYTASVIKALLIQLKTTFTKWDESGVKLVKADEIIANHGRNAATWLYLGMLLGKLVKTDGTPSEWENPFDAILPKT
jgi:hypothetical protein